VERLYALSADLIVAFHLLYVGFAIGGELAILVGFKWEWVRNLAFRIIHLIAVVIVAVESLVGAVCPLTDWEYQLRQLAGQSVDREISFVGRLLRRIIFYDLPPWLFTVIYIAFALLVVASFFLVPPRRRRTSHHLTSL
jgi:hypothetical protein